MISESDLKEIKPELSNGTFSPLHIQSGVPIPKPTRVKFLALKNGKYLLKNVLVP